MAAEKKADYMVDNGTDFDQVMFKTIASQVRYTKDSSGNETSVEDIINTIMERLTKLLSLKTHESCNIQGYGIYEVYNSTAGSNGLPSGENRGVVVGFCSTLKDVYYQLFLSYTGHAYYRVWINGKTYGTFKEL